MKNQSKRRMKTPSAIAPSLAAASRATGISRQTLRAFREEMCPAFLKNGKVNLAVLDAWAAASDKRTHRDNEATMALRSRILSAQAEKLERENRRQGGQVVDKAQIA